MNSILEELKNKLKPITEFIKDKNDVFYFDYPLYLNVGDLLIYQGTLQFFKDHQINLRLQRCVYDFDLNEIKQQISPNTTILCNGGGNFGDLYPMHQNLRESLVKNFPNNPIIILPQTVYFEHQNNLNQSAEIFSQHKHCYLLVRDLRSQQCLQQFSDKVYLFPDMAHQLYGKYPGYQQNKNSTLYFLRKDIEATDIEKNIIKNLDNNANIKDWEDILSKIDYQILRLCKHSAKLKFPWLSNLISKFWQYYSFKITHRVANIFLQNNKVITTRLHGHIFSCLLEMSNQVYDNSYGKNTAYASLWTKQLDFVELKAKE